VEGAVDGGLQLFGYCCSTRARVSSDTLHDLYPLPEKTNPTCLGRALIIPLVAFAIFFKEIFTPPGDIKYHRRGGARLKIAVDGALVEVVLVDECAVADYRILHQYSTIIIFYYSSPIKEWAEVSWHRPLIFPCSSSLILHLPDYRESVNFG